MTNNPINWWIRQMIRCVSKILPTDWMNASMQWVSLHSPDEWKWTLARTAPFLYNNTKTLKLKLNHFTKKTSLLLCQINYNDDVLGFQKQQSILMFQERRGRAWRRARSLLLLRWPAKLKERVVVVVVGATIVRARFRSTIGLNDIFREDCWFFWTCCASAVLRQQQRNTPGNARSKPLTWKRSLWQNKLIIPLVNIMHPQIEPGKLDKITWKRSRWIPLNRWLALATKTPDQVRSWKCLNEHVN